MALNYDENTLKPISFEKAYKQRLRYIGGTRKGEREIFIDSGSYLKSIRKEGDGDNVDAKIREEVIEIVRESRNKLSEFEITNVRLEVIDGEKQIVIEGNFEKEQERFII